jgi:hypothetical protein
MWVAIITQLDDTGAVKIRIKKDKQISDEVSDKILTEADWTRLI